MAAEPVVQTAAPSPSSSVPSQVSTSAPTPSATQEVPSSTSMATPSVSNVAPPALQPVITQAYPSRIAIPGIGYEAHVGDMQIDAKGNIKPLSLQDAYLITNVAKPEDPPGIPGSDAKNTVYIACHAWGGHDAPCNLVPQVVPGQHVLVTTPNGTLDYVVQVTKLFSKNGEFKNSDEVRAKVPGRLVLVTCYELNGVSTQNFVVFAQLVTE